MQIENLKGKKKSQPLFSNILGRLEKGKQTSLFLGLMFVQWGKGPWQTKLKKCIVGRPGYHLSAMLGLKLDI